MIPGSSESVMGAVIPDWLWLCLLLFLPYVAVPSNSTNHPIHIILSALDMSSPPELFVNLTTRTIDDVEARVK